MEYDLLISGGSVVDGSGADSVRADVGVKDGRIARIGDLGGDSAAETIDATNKVVTPGLWICIPTWTLRLAGIP